MSVARTESEAAQAIRDNSIPEPTTGCHLWLAVSDKNGYGKIHFNKKHWRAHRLSYHLSRGPVGPKDLVCHKCDTPACVNPDHLFLDTPLGNMRDKVAKGRLRNQHMEKTHCKNGHEFTPENIRKELTPIGTPRRVCLTCYTAYYKARNLKNKKTRIAA